MIRTLIVIALAMSLVRIASADSLLHPEQPLPPDQEELDSETRDIESSESEAPAGPIDFATATPQELHNQPWLSVRDIHTFLQQRAAATPAPRASPSAVTRRKQRASRWLLQARVHASPSDRSVPSMLAHVGGAYAQTTGGLTLATTRMRIASLRATQSGLQAEPAGYQLQIARWGLATSSWGYRFYVGNYAVGFAERVTFDTTGTPEPGRARLALDADLPAELVAACRVSGDDACEGTGNLRVSPDARWSRALRGIAMETPLWRLTTRMRASATLFVSARSGSAYQYELFDHRFCDDPLQENCSAPAITLPDTSQRHAYQSLHDIYREWLGGAHVQIESGSLRVGATAYGATPTWQVPNARLDFQDWSRMPYGGKFSAFGADARWLGKRWRIATEWAIARHSMPGRGGLAGVVRAVCIFRHIDCAVSFRHYTQDFANPYTRSLAAADEYRGQRARDETGLRVNWATSWPTWLEHKTALDIWRRATLGVFNASLSTQFAVHIAGTARFGMAVALDDKAVGERSSLACYDVTPANGTCNGRRLRWAAFATAGARSLRLLARWQLAQVDDMRLDGEGRFDISARAAARVHLGFVTGDARVGYRHLGVGSGLPLERFLSATLRLRFGDSSRYLTLEAASKSWLDSRASTQARTPNPEFLLGLAVRYER